jgi:hypothetical protein
MFQEGELQRQKSAIEPGPLWFNRALPVLDQRLYGQQRRNDDMPSPFHDRYKHDGPFPFPEQAASSGFTLDRSSLIEPTPINPQGPAHHVCQVLTLLPPSLTMYCDDYIGLLSKVDITDHEEDTPAGGGGASVIREDNAATIHQPQTGDESDDTSQITADAIRSSDRFHPYQNQRWLERYQELFVYARVHGHFNIPLKEKSILFQWVKRQRHQYKLRRQGQNSNLTEVRIHLLESIGFVWDSHSAAWDEKFQELKEFREDHGNCFVPCIHKGNNKLSTWIKRQRCRHRRFMSNQTSTMTPERIAKLENLGFAWDYYKV